MSNIEPIKNDLENASKPPYMPFGFEVRSDNDTLYRTTVDDEYPICDPLYIEAMARSHDGHGWGRLLVWKDKDGTSHEWAMPSEMLAGDGSDYRRILLDRGLCIRSGRKAQNALHDYIAGATPPERALSVNMTGWHGKLYIGLDNAVYGAGDGRILLQISGTPPKINRLGTLDEWQEHVARYAVGNSRLLFALSAAFASILLYPANEGSGGIHLSGGSSTGKTTALRVSASAWGVSTRSWRTTDNAAESWARFANDGFLPIDELGQVDGRSASAMAYMLGNGQTKGRSNRNGIARETSEFRLLFLSTGEIGLADKIGEGGGKAKAGQAVRMLEIPADAGAGMGIFENLHGFNGGAEFSKHLAVMADQYKGHAADAFLTQVTALPFDELQATITTLMSGWTNEYIPDDADGQVKRVGNKFALIAVAGEMAATFKIVPWIEGEASQAALTCFNAWLKERGGLGSHEVQEGINSILSFIETHGASRFQDMDSASEKIINRAGFKRMSDTDDAQYLVFPDVFRKEVLSGSKNYTDIIKSAIKRGLLTPDKEESGTINVRIPSVGQKRMYCITPAKYNDEVTS